MKKGRRKGNGLKKITALMLVLVLCIPNLINTSAILASSDAFTDGGGSFDDGDSTVGSMTETTTSETDAVPPSEPETAEDDDDIIMADFVIEGLPASIPMEAASEVTPIVESTEDSPAEPVAEFSETPMESTESTESTESSDQAEEQQTVGSDEDVLDETEEQTTDVEEEDSPEESEETEFVDADVEEEAPETEADVFAEGGDADDQAVMVQVTADEANLRYEPSAESGIIAVLPAGTQLVLLETVDVNGETWYRVQYNESEGYLRSDVAEPVEEPEGEESVITRYDYQSDEINVLVTLTDPADLPDNAELVVTPVELSTEAEQNVTEEAAKEEKAIEKMVAYDISFVLDGAEVEPGSTVKVSVSLPEIEAGQEAAVFHVDENDAVENMNGTVEENGDVVFETDHFSTYVIIQQGNSEVKIRIEHYDNSGETPVEIYSADELTLPVGGKVNNYAKATNWDVQKVTKVDSECAETDITDPAEITVASDTTFKVYYIPKTGEVSGATTLYDYTVKAGNVGRTYYSINMPVNYGDKSSANNKLTVGTSEHNYKSYRYSCNVPYGNNDTKNANEWLGSGVNDPNNMVKGLVKGLDSEGNVEFNYAEPGFFVDSDASFQYTSNETRYTRKVYKDYKLVFNQTGDTYVLNKVNDGNGTQVATAGSDFFPLNSVRPTYASDDTPLLHSNDNIYFGMRYDVTFKIGDYTGPLNYEFTGDDDLWVILDGNKVVIDLGGIHDASTDDVDLWTYILEEDQAITDLSTEQKEQEHTLTVLYMERGGYASNCNMKFTLPSAQISDVTTVPMADLLLKKVNKSGDPLEGARFTLTDSNGNTVSTAASTSDGVVKFSKLKEGTYTLTEDAAPTGYIPSLDSWIVKVNMNSDGTVVATMYLSDGLTEYTDKSGSYYQIINVTQQEIIDGAMDYNKTVHVRDWDARTYNINITAASKVTSSTTTETGGVADVMMVLDTSGSMLYDGSSATDEDGFEEVGRYRNVRDDLDKTKVYYYKDEIKRVTASNSVGSWNYYNAAYPMINLNDRWMYYNNGNWTSIDNSNGSKIYTIDSSLTGLKEAAMMFTSSAASVSADSRLGIATFDFNGNLKAGLTTLNDSNVDTLNKTIVALTAQGGTSPYTGLNLAKEQLKNNARENVSQYVVLFTDGAPSTDDDRSKSELSAEQLRQDGIIVYTIGLGLTDATADWLEKKIASEGCAFTASNIASLKEIFKKIQETITQNVNITNAEIKDVIDSRFIIVDENGHKLDEGSVYNGGTVHYNSESGCYYIVWSDETIPNTSNGNTWSKTIIVKAKDEYIGGNNIPTNVSPDSRISTGYGNAILPQPTVNVKSELLVNNNEKTIFLGETVPTDEDILKVLFDTADVREYVEDTPYTIGTNGQSLNANDFTITWYTDEACTTQITLEDMAEVAPTEETKYYLKVTYNALGEPTESSTANTTIDNTGYVAGDNTSGKVITAHNSEDLKTRPYGVYTIKVVSGSIDVVKTLISDNEYVASKKPTFVFTVKKQVSSTDENGQSVTNMETMGTVEITFDTSTDTSTVVYKDADGEEDADLLSKLPLGIYSVEETVTTNNFEWISTSASGNNKTESGSSTSYPCKASLSEDKRVATFEIGMRETEDTSDEYLSRRNGIASFVNQRLSVITINKTDASGSTKLKDVQFKIEKKNGDNYEAMGTNGTDETVTTDDNGQAKFENLSAGTYRITEIKAKEGYSLLANPIVVTLPFTVEPGEGASVDKSKGVVLYDGETTGYFDITYNIKNNELFDMPQGGGSGTKTMTFAGIFFIIAAAGITLFFRRRRIY